jgi:hypothetical protein
MKKTLQLLALLTVVISLLTPAKAADSPWLYGIHFYGDGSQTDVEDMTGGKGIWSLEVVLPYSDTWWQLSGQEWKFQQITAKGHTLIIRIEPNWGYAIPVTPAERTQYLTDLTAIANQAKDYCHIWQIGNEMNLYGEYGGNVLTATEYIDFYKQARAAIKSVTSPLGDQIVLVGPVSPGAYAGEVRHTDGLVYLRQMCEALTASDTDGFAIHSYGAPWFDGNTAANDFMSGVSSQLEVIDDEGFCDKPAFITEWNRQTNPPTDANQEAHTAQFIKKSYELLDTWNQNPANHPVVCACWFIYNNDSAWASMSLRYLKDIGPRGEDADVWDAFQATCGQGYAAGDMTPISCDQRPATPTPIPVTPEIEKSESTTTAGLAYQPSSSDAINGQVGTMISGGFHSAVTNNADKEPCFTDGASLGALTGLLMDYPGSGAPAWSGYWTLDGGSPANISEIRVFTGNNGKDGRVYHYYDTYVTEDANPTSISTWIPLLEGIKSATLGDINASNLIATMTAVTNSEGGNLVSAMTGIRFDFYASSSENKDFLDPYDAGASRDEDGEASAYVSPLLYEVDVFTNDQSGIESWMFY